MWRRVGVLVALSWCCLPAASRGEIEVKGRVLTAAAEPLSDVQVGLSRWPSRFQLGALLAEGETHPPPVSTIRTDELGRFRLFAPAPGMWTVTVHVDGFLAMEHPLLPLLESVELRTLTLRRASDRGVRVLDAQGRPVAGALAKITEALRWGRWNDSLGGWWPSSPVSVADEQGRLALPVGHNESLEMLTWAPGYLETVAKSGRGSLEVRLQEGISRRLEIRRADGQPASGALVSVGKGAWPAVWSTENGKVTVAVSSGIGAALEVILEDGYGASFSLAPAESAVEQATVLTLPPEQTLGGWVVNARDQAPMVGAWVWAREDPTVFAHTDSTGGYSLPLAPRASDTRVSAAAAGYLPGSEDISTDSAAVPAPIIALEPAARLSGVVVDPEGVAVAFARIEALPAPGRSAAGRAPVSSISTSDSRGRFRFTDLAMVTRYELIARAGGFAPTRLEVAELGPPSSHIRIVLDRGRRAFGVVLDGDELPVVGAEVALRPTVARQGGAELSVVTTTGEDGVFEVFNLSPGRYDLSVVAAKLAPAVIRGLAISSAEEAADLGTVFLAPGVVVEGRVLDDDRQPLNAVSVHARVQGAGSDPATAGQQLSTAVDGVFTASGLRPGERIELQLWKAGYQTRLVSGIEAPTVEPLTIVLKLASRISGTVVDGDRRPVARARVGLIRRGSGLVLDGRLVDSGSGGHSSLSDTDGTFAIENVAPGKYALAVVAEGYRPLEAGELEVAAGHDIEDRILSLDAGAVLEGQVLRPDGQPVSGARVAVVTGSSASSSPPATTGGDGSYRLVGLLTGPVSIEASHRDHQRVVRDLRVRPGLNDLDLTFEPGFEVGGRVVTGAGTPVLLTRLSLEPGGSQATTDSGGEFTFAGVGNGQYRIRVDKTGYPSVTVGEEVAVVDGPVYGLEVLMEAGGSITGNLRGLNFEELSQVAVAATSPGHSRVPGTTHHNGAYQIERLVPGEWTVSADLPGDPRQARGRVTLESEVPEVQLDLDFSSGLTLSGWVLDRGEPLTGAVVMLSAEQMAAATARTHADGDFRIAGLEAGRYRLTVADFELGLNHAQDVEIDGDHELIIEVATARVAGRVLDALDRSPLESAIVSLEPVSGGGETLALSPGATTDASGRFVLRGLADGEWRLIVRNPGYAGVEILVPVRAGSGAEGLEIALEAAGR